MKYENTVQDLIKRFPDFVSSIEFQKDEAEFPYATYTYFAQYLCRIINESKDFTNEQKVIDMCKLIDEMSNSDEKVRDLLIVGIFEEIRNQGIDQLGKTLEALNTLLSEKSKKIMKGVVEWKQPVPLNRFLLEDDEDENK